MGITDQVKGAVDGAIGALNPLAKGDQPVEDTTPQSAAERHPAPAAPTGDTEEVRVARAEEFDVAAVGRQAGSVGVRKTVQTETEQVEVPLRREEVQVDRVPVGEPTEAAGIGAEEIRAHRRA